MADKFLHAPEMTDEVIMKAFEGTNFGRTDYRQFLGYSVLEKACGWHCGWTITTIMIELKLITPKHHRVTKLGRMFLSDCYSDPPAPVLKPIEAPGTKCLGWVRDTIREHDEKWKDAIRVAGYEVK